jgi:hypothetical protein
MNKAVVTIILGLALGMAAIAQTTPGTTPPSGTTPSTQPQTSPSQTQKCLPLTLKTPRQTGKATRASRDVFNPLADNSCWKMVMESRPLAGSQDFASHVGHTVTVHGSFANVSDASSAASASSSNNRNVASGQQFTVSKLDMVSEQYSSSKSKNKDTKNDSGKTGVRIFK